jgi:hypothetical protein
MTFKNVEIGKARRATSAATLSPTLNWSTFIDEAPPAEHAVQVYDEPGELVASVTRFLDAGFRAGEPAVVLATAAHWEGTAAELEARSWDLGALEQQGLLMRRDAEQTLAAFMEGDVPSQTRFDHVVGGLVDDVAARFPGRTVRAFGEMVDVLWRTGRAAGAMLLEDLWNALQRTRGFALLCGYQLDIFDVDVQANALPAVFGMHTHARPAADSSRLATALHRALTEIIGPVEAARTYLDVAEHVPQTSLPRAHAVLAWLSANDAGRARNVLERTQAHYLRLRKTPRAASAA